MDVAIIDYGVSNLHSVKEACLKVGLSVTVTSESERILESKVAILPGVGAFGEAMNQLEKFKLDQCIVEFVKTGKPFIGICLGLQLLFEKSDEFGSNKGLGLIKGSVKKFKFNFIEGTKYPVPKVGWNKIKKCSQSWEKTFLGNNNEEDFMYFVHSYYVDPKDKDIILSKTKYGNQSYCSSIQFNNIFATQFHPEKSGDVGMRIYEKIKYKLRNH